MDFSRQYGAISSGRSTPQPGGRRAHRKATVEHSLLNLVDSRAGCYEEYRKSPEDLRGMKKALRQFYEKQNETLDRFREVDAILSGSSLHRSPGFNRCDGGVLYEESEPLLPAHVQTEFNPSEDGHQDRVVESQHDNGDTPMSKQDKAVLVAIYVNFAVNIVLLGGKILVALLSNSISLIASLVDSAMDLLSTVIIYGANRAMHANDWKAVYFYPTGRRRMEPMGVVIFSVCMITSFVQVFIEAFQRVLSPELDVAEIPLQGIVVMVATIVIKGVVWVVYRSNKSTSVQALAQDAQNDCVFNFFSLVFPFVGQKIGESWLDPAGAMILSVYIICEWVDTLISNVRNLTGRRASPEEHQRVAYLVTRFSPLVEAIQNCQVYQSGDDVIVEVDLILAETTSLPIAHDLGESVQYALEGLEGVSRAYCHVDFRRTGPEGHVRR